jgi:hypothetical protein
MAQKRFHRHFETPGQPLYWIILAYIVLGWFFPVIGLLAVMIVGGTKLYCLTKGIPHPLVTRSPYFSISLTMMIVGTQLFVAGFLGELISRNAPERNNYQIEKIL